MRRYSNIGITIAILLISLVLVSCSSKSSEAPTKPRATNLSQSPMRSTSVRDRDLAKVNSVVVLPLGVSNRASLTPVGAKNLYFDLQKAIKKELELKIIAGDDVVNKVPVQSRALNSRDAMQIAADFGADAALVTRINAYEERSGSRAGSEQTAKVDFSMHLYRAEDGKEVWNASYHFSDDAWTDNLFEIGNKVRTRKGRGFLTAEELARNGFDEAMQDFQRRRVKQFAAQQQHMQTTN